MRNNIIYVKDKAISNKPSFSHDHNLYYRLDGSTDLGFALGEGEQITDPLFINLAGEDFHLRSESSAIDAGVDLNYSLDFDGQSVPVGPAPDIGAYEYIGGVPPSPSPSFSPSPSSTPTQSPTTTPTPTPPSHCPPLGDIDCSGKVNGIDFGYLVAHWGTVDPQANLDNLGVVDAKDTLILLSNYGQQIP